MDGIMDDVGWVQTVVVNERTMHVIDGHMRVELAIINGEEEIPVTFIDVSDEEEEKLLILFDPVATLSRQNKERVEKIIKGVELNSASAQDFVRNIAKKHKIDMRQYLDTGDENSDVKVVLPEDNMDDNTEIQPGDIFEIYNPSSRLAHRLMCADNTDEENWKKLFGTIRPTLCVTSPPYNQKINSFKPSGMQLEHVGFVDRMAGSYEDSIPEEEYQEKQVDMINRICKYLAPNGSLFYNHKIRYRGKKIVSPMEWILRCDYPVRQEIIWDRGGSITLNARMLMPVDERIYWIRAGDDFVFNDEVEIKSWGTVWRFAAKNDVKVSAAFAYELPYRCILTCSKAGDVVFDPYCGSGTTIVAANRTKRIGYGMEVNPSYIKQSIERFEKEGLIISKVKE